MVSETIQDKSQHRKTEQVANSLFNFMLYVCAQNLPEPSGAAVIARSPISAGPASLPKL